jgi:hypothetical protein
LFIVKLLCVRHPRHLRVFLFMAGF